MWKEFLLKHENTKLLPARGFEGVGGGGAGGGGDGVGGAGVGGGDGVGCAGAGGACSVFFSSEAGFTSSFAASGCVAETKISRLQWAIAKPMLSEEDERTRQTLLWP